MNPTLNITANETTKSTVGGTSGNGRTVEFTSGVIVTKTLNDMGLEFTIDAPEDMTIHNQLQSMSKEERGKLAVTMLTTGMYLADGNTSSFTMNSALSAFLNSQINQISGKALRTLDLNFGVENSFGNNGTLHNFNTLGINSPPKSTAVLRMPFAASCSLMRCSSARFFGNGNAQCRTPYFQCSSVSVLPWSVFLHHFRFFNRCFIKHGYNEEHDNAQQPFKINYMLQNMQCGSQTPIPQGPKPGKSSPERTAAAAQTGRKHRKQKYAGQRRRHRKPCHHGF